MRLVDGSAEVPECSGAAAGEYDGGGAVVVVGVKLDSRSKELLTWALVKAASSGDRVIALHILDPDAGEDFRTPKHAHLLFFCYIFCVIFHSIVLICLSFPYERCERVFKLEFESSLEVFSFQFSVQSSSG